MKRLLTALMLTALAGSAHAGSYPHDYPAPVVTGHQKLVLTWTYDGPPCDFVVKHWDDPNDYGSGELLGYVEGEAPHRFVVQDVQCGFYGVIGIVEGNGYLIEATKRPVLVEVPCE